MGSESWFSMTEGLMEHLDVVRALRVSNQISFAYESDNSVPDLWILVWWVQADKPTKTYQKYTGYIR